MKKLLALFLTLCMLLSVVSVMAVNVGADGETADATRTRARYGVV